MPAGDHTDLRLSFQEWSDRVQSRQTPVTKEQLAAALREALVTGRSVYLGEEGGRRCYLVPDAKSHA